jgi:perosamine synthetase
MALTTAPTIDSRSTTPVDRFPSIRNPQHFTRKEAVPQQGIDWALACMRSGEMFRYGASDPEASQVLQLEREFAAYMGTKYALGVNSCSTAIMLSLVACGARAGDVILLPGFTFTAVPSAVVNLGLTPCFVEIDEDYRVDLDDLDAKARSAKFFLISHMRGHLSNMAKVVSICENHEMILIEDAAHALGSRWGGKLIGTFGTVGCYSAQSYKILNAGEGGLITTESEQLIAELIYRSGAYEELHRRHRISSPAFETFRDRFAINNLRMNEITGAIIRSQLPYIEERSAMYRRNYEYLVAGLSRSDVVELPKADRREERVPDSIQFRLKGFTAAQVAEVLRLVKAAGLPLSAFGVDKHNARFFRNWRYCETPSLPRTEAAIAHACDVRLPCSLTQDDLDDFVRVLLAAIERTRSAAPAAGFAAP